MHFRFGVSVENHNAFNGFFCKAVCESILSRILWIVNICDVIDLFLRRPFYFFLRMLSIWGCMRLRSRILYILAAMDVSVIPR